MQLLPCVGERLSQSRSQTLTCARRPPERGAREGLGTRLLLWVLSLVPRPHPQNGKGSGDIRALSWLCCVSSHVTTTRHAYGIRRTVLYVVSCVLLTTKRKRFPICGWGLGTGQITSLVPRPHPQMGKGLVTFERFLGCAVSAERTRLHTVQYVLCHMRAA